MKAITINLDEEDLARLRGHANRVAQNRDLRGLLGREITLGVVGRMLLLRALDAADAEAASAEQTMEQAVEHAVALGSVARTVLRKAETPAEPVAVEPAVEPAVELTVEQRLHAIDAGFSLNHDPLEGL